MGSMELDRLLREGIAAARAGQRERARELLLQIIALDERVEAAWLWLSGVVDDPEEQRICLENVLSLNPNNAAAQDGLRWLNEQGLLASSRQTSFRQQEEPPRLVLRAVPDESAQPAPPPPPQPVRARVEIDSYGCPYCGGSVSGSEPRCDFCGRLVSVRIRERAEETWPGWLVLFFLLLALAVWLEGFLVSQLTEVQQLPRWLGQTAVRFMVGSALFSPEGVPGDLAELAGTIALINYLVGGLCVVAAVGLALRSRAAYFGSFLLAGLMMIASGVGLLTGLTGWLPALFRLGLVAISVRWLVDNAPAFEWETRQYSASVDQDLRTDMDYYNRGQRYRGMGMWAKAAAHWKVATQLASNQAQYHVALANAYLKMDYPEAALAEADRALALIPEDEALRAFRDSLAELEGAR